METVTRLELARSLAAFAHAGQTDKSGKPYILHPLAVAAQLGEEDEKIVALLHDTVEDTFLALSTIRNLFGDRVAEAVDAMTHREGEPYDSYVRRLGENPLARKVKLADLHHNMDLSRLPEITEKDLQRAEKYKRAEQYLLSLK